MVNQHTYSNALGICGNISSMFLFLSPLPTFARIFKTKDVGQFTPAPYILTVLNCCFWIIYGLPSVKNLMLVISINSAGLVIEFIYVTIYMVYAKGSNKIGWNAIQSAFSMLLSILGDFEQKDSDKELTLSILYWKVSHSMPTDCCKKQTTTFIGLCCVLFGVVAGVTLGRVHQDVRWKVIGAVCVSIGIIQNFAPLMVIRTVIRTKSAEFLPILLSTWIVINGCLWTAYGSWPYDIFIIIPNAFAIAFGIMQVVLWAIYRKNPKAQLDYEKCWK